MERKTIEISKDLDLEVEFDYTPADPGVHTYPNGDPGYPPTSEEYEILIVTATTANGSCDITDLIAELDAWEWVEEQIRKGDCDDF